MIGCGGAVGRWNIAVTLFPSASFVCWSLLDHASRNGSCDLHTLSNLLHTGGHVFMHHFQVLLIPKKLEANRTSPAIATNSAHKPIPCCFSLALWWNDITLLDCWLRVAQDCLGQTRTVTSLC